MDISIVIPAYDESKKIELDIEAASAFIQNNHLTGEIIVVDDGSKDNTAVIAQDVRTPENIALNVIRYEQHRGKGFAVKKGIESSKGYYVMFADSGLCVPYQKVLDGLSLIKSDQSDIAHGSRKLQDSIIHIQQSWSRKLSSKIIKCILLYWLKIPSYLTDTQCGFKIYIGDIARRLYKQCNTDGFLFDVEIILRAQKYGFRILEFPIEWTADRDSRLSAVKHFKSVLQELFYLKKLLSSLKAE